MVYRMADGFEETELEAVSAFDTDAEVWKDKEALMRAIDILEVVETGYAGAARVSCLAVVEQVKFLIRFGVA